MKKKKKNIILKLLVLIVIIILIFRYKDNFLDIFKKENAVEVNDSIPFDIINTSELDSEIIENFFANGMYTEDFNNILNQKENYIKNTHEYEYLSYNFDKKLHYSDIEDYLNKLNYSNIVNLEIIGKSADNRNMYSIEIGKGTNEVLIDSNIHAAESGNVLMLLKYMITIVNEYENNNKGTIEMLNNIKLVILPCINVDGYEIYNFGIESLNNKNLWIYKNKENVDFENFKFNANGIDLNRNMPTENAGLYYKKNKLINSVSLDKTTKNNTYFGGTSLGSEPETKALMYFMLKHYKNASAYINMHSQGRVIYQGKPNLNIEFNNLCYELALLFSNYTKYSIQNINTEEVGEGNDGSATDFMAELANGFKFSTITGRLSNDKYESKDTLVKYYYGVITAETIDTYTSDPNYFKKEYEKRNYYELINNLLKKYSD